jgi:hypothetical protein
MGAEERRRRRWSVRDNGDKSLLAVAIEREEWEVAALCLLIGAVEAANKLPRETLEALLDEVALEAVLEGPKATRGKRRERGHRGSRARRRGEQHGRA